MVAPDSPFGRFRFQMDWTIFLLVVSIAAIGLMNLYSATGGKMSGRFLQQVYWLILGTSAFLVVATIDYRQFNQHGYWIYLTWLLVLLATLFIGRRVKGSTRWIGYGPLQLQPSELMKIVLIVAVAKYLHNEPTLEGRGLKGLAIPFGLLALPVVLILAQPDLGTGLIIVLIFFSLMLMTRLRLRSFLVLLSTLVVIAPVTWSFVLEDYQKRRFLSFLDPDADPTGAGYHLKQSIIAIGSGEMLGKGFRQGTQTHLRFLPETWTDFPFALWAEEWGFLGGIVLLGLYLFLIVWATNLARTARDRFASVLCMGVALMFFWHVLINIGMVSGLLPIVGMTLPLVSYGGSSVLTFMIGAGLLMNVSIRRYSS
ncbi:MAG: rod shape-determining protein RodA [Polyangia bacterium]|jgi:rod shape determining protein RodA|nr:rod shape-determining protein RodA [Polyangia bacterium]